MEYTIVLNENLDYSFINECRDSSPTGYQVSLFNKLAACRYLPPIPHRQVVGSVTLYVDRPFFYQDFFTADAPDIGRAVFLFPLQTTRAFQNRPHFQDLP